MHYLNKFTIILFISLPVIIALSINNQKCNASNRNELLINLEQNEKQDDSKLVVMGTSENNIINDGLYNVFEVDYLIDTKTAEGFYITVVGTLSYGISQYPIFIPKAGQIVDSEGFIIEYFNVTGENDNFFETKQDHHDIKSCFAMNKKHF